MSGTTPTGDPDARVAAMAAQPGQRGRASKMADRVVERGALDQLIEAVRADQSRALVVRGDAGVGKTVLLEYLAVRASALGCRMARAMGVQSEMELAFAGLHQLCGPMLDRAERLPTPQRNALRIAFGLAAGPPPDRFLVGLAVLNLLSGVAGEQPLICLIDDEQWLDQASAQVLGFVARRLAADPVGLVFAAREPGPELAGLPAMELGGLRGEDARALLASALAGPLDPRVADLIIAETRGNPLALLQLPRGLTPEELAGGFGLPGAAPLAGRIEDSFLRQLEALPDPTRLLLLLAAADPSGDPGLVRRAAARLDLTMAAGEPAVEAGLADFGAQVRFRHPLARSAVYRSASFADRYTVHGALAEETDPMADPDRRAWHRAQGSAGPDEGIAAELESSAGRAQARGGLAAAAAFLERAALLTSDPRRRARRLLASAKAKREAGALDAASELLTAAETRPMDALGAAEAERLRGQIASDQRRIKDSVTLLLSAARLFAPVSVGLARETYLEALFEAAMWIGDVDTRGGAAQAAREAPPAPPGSPRPVDALLDALVLRFTDGYAAAEPAVTQALALDLALDVRSEEARRWLWSTAGNAGGMLAMELWDFASWQTLTARNVQVAREAGALVQLRHALQFPVPVHIHQGDLAAAARVIEEDRVIAGVTGPSPVAAPPMVLAAWRGDEAQAMEMTEAIVRDGTSRGLDMLVAFAMMARSVLFNGLGRYSEACACARHAFDRDHFGYETFVVPELAEAASRTGDAQLVRAVLEWLSERTSMTPTDWVIGIEARVRAFLGDDDAEHWYRESIKRLGQTEIRAQLARSHLLYGEWLRRQNRRADAREQLRTAHQMLAAMGIEGFAERARQELIATGETARKRSVETDTTLTAQEALIARLARDGRTNPEIGAQLFLSARTVQYHLRKVFTKLGISSRRELPAALEHLGPDSPPA
jgi:DNA-binding CsgD family transcriptional regulator/tetratricopeptide (TPR) repeat protein